MTRIWLVADDYGLSRGVNGAIRGLLARGRISATSVMVVAPAFVPEATQALAAIDLTKARRRILTAASHARASQTCEDPVRV